MKQIHIPKRIKNLMQILVDNHFDVHIVGGAVRDSIIGLEPNDWDLFTNASGQELLNIFPSGKVLGGAQRQEKILTVIVDGTEISTYRKNGNRTQTGSSLKEHLDTCDFTINAIAIDINGVVFDPFNGIEDIQNTEFGFVGNPKDRIEEDPLRIFRAVRFCVQLGFSFRHNGALREYKDRVLQLPKERIREEFIKIMKYHGGVEYIIAQGLMYCIIPKWNSLFKLPGGPHHNETVDEHSVYAFNFSKQASDNWKVWLAALLHDIGKGDTFSQDEDGTIHFYEHEKVGADYVKQWMTEMKFATKEIDFVVCLVRNHMWGFMDTDKKRNFIKHFQYFRQSGVHILDFLALTYSDNQGNMKNTRRHFSRYLRYCGLVEKYYEMLYSREPFTVGNLEIGGKDLMKLGIQPGREMGLLLQHVFDKVMEGELRNDKPELLNYVRGTLK